MKLLCSACGGEVIATQLLSMPPIDVYTCRECKREVRKQKEPFVKIVDMGGPRIEPGNTVRGLDCPLARCYVFLTDDTHAALIRANNNGTVCACRKRLDRLWCLSSSTRAVLLQESLGKKWRLCVSREDARP